MRKSLKIIGGAIGVLLVVIIVFAQIHKVKPLSWVEPTAVNAASGVAIDGYDAVSYHTQGQAIMGTKKFTTEWNNITWQFSTIENLELFKTNPEQYAPRLGGYCAFAVSSGFTADCSKETWVIENGGLYFFKDENVKQSWLAEKPNGIIEKTEANWNK